MSPVPKKTRADLDAQIASLVSGEVLARFPRIREIGLLTQRDAAQAAARRVVYEWEGVACAGNIVALVGGPGGGKTTLAYAALAARANLTDRRLLVLGREMLRAPRGKLVVLVQEEVPDNLSDAKLDEALALWGMPPEAKDGRILRVCQSGEKLGGRLWTEIAEMVHAGLVDSIWIDSLSHVQPLDSDKEEDQVRVLAYLQQLVQSSPDDRKPTVWIIAHPRKGATGESATDMSGSTQRAAQVDVAVWVALEKEGNRITGSRSHFMKVRYAEGGVLPEPCSFSIVRGARGEVSAKWSTEEGEVGRGPVTEDEVLEVLREMAGRGVDGLTVSALCKGVARNRGSTSPGAKADRDTVMRLLGQLAAAGKASECTIAQRKGDPFKGWRLGAEGGTVAGAVAVAAPEREPDEA